MKKIFVSVFVIALVFSITFLVSCVKRPNPNGPSAVDAGTPTPAPTPDYNFGFYLYAQQTPQANTLVTMSTQPGVNPTQVVTLYTNPDGSGTFADLHTKGVWNIDVGASFGYLEGNYSVDTRTTTFTAINRGPGTITITQKGSTNTTNNIPIIATSIIYTATLSTTAPMTYNISVLSDCTFTASGALPVSYTVSTTNGLGTLVNNGDVATITLYFNDAEGDYGSSFYFWLSAKNNLCTITTSKMSIVKDWTCSIVCDTYYSETFTGSVNSPSYDFFGSVSEACQYTNFMYRITGPVIAEAIYPAVVGSGYVNPGGAVITNIQTTYDTDDVYENGQLSNISGNNSLERIFGLPYVDIQFTDEQSRNVIKMRFTSPTPYTPFTTTPVWNGGVENGPFYYYLSGVVQGVQIP
jgi:hypothetical protein